MRRHHPGYLARQFWNPRANGRQPLVLAGLVAVAALCFLIVIMPGGDAGSISAQISPLSPLGAPAVTGGAPLSLSQLPFINVMASGQAGLTSLALLLLGIILGVGIIIWRQP